MDASYNVPPFAYVVNFKSVKPISLHALLNPHSPMPEWVHRIIRIPQWRIDEILGRGQ